MAFDRLEGTFLGNIEPTLLAQIDRRASVETYGRGELLFTDAEAGWTGIVLSGMVRVFLRTYSGRQVTLRHALPPSSIGIGTLLAEGALSAQAITESEVLRLDTMHLLQLADSNPSVGMAIAEELNARLTETYREMVTREQGTVRQRLARQLLQLCGGSGDPNEALVIEVSHEQIADALGTSREVVSRHLAWFQAERMLELERGQIRLIDPVRIDETASVPDAPEHGRARL